MTFLEFLDRMGERRMQRPRADARLFIGAGFLVGYYALAWRLMSAVVPAESVPLVRDMLLVLGPAVGLIVGAMFRSDRRDEQAAANTGKAFDTMREAINATPPEPVAQESKP